MEDPEGGLSFDFEGGLDVAPTVPTASNPVIQPEPNAAPTSYAAAAAPQPPADQFNGPGNRRSFRQTVCRHWLRSLCMKGDSCGFLHQYDKARMPICRFFRMYGECREQDCVYKHTNEDIKECNMYKLGFCPNGPDCRYRHAKQPGPPPPVDEILQKIQQLTSYNYNGPNRFYQQRNTNYSQQSERPQFPQGGNATNQAVVPKPSTTELPNMQQQPQDQKQQAGQVQVQNPAGDPSNLISRTATPLPQGITRYFIVKSCNRENLELSVQQGVWATQRSNEAKLNEAFDSVEHVILIFSVNRTRNFQGCAKMSSKIGESAGGGNWKHAHGTAHYGRNFSVKWLKLCELSFNKTRHLRNPYNENLPVKISRDCQELEPSVGEQLASLLYLEPDNELMEILVAAESKREEEKAKGVTVENGTENPDIVPFDDNEEEEEEEESEEEEEGFGQAPGVAFQGRGRGRGMMWPPNFPMGRGMRPMPRMGGFPTGTMGVDGFAYGPGPGPVPDAFPMPDPFGMAPRPFMPYGPRFPNDFQGPAPGMMFHGRPQPGVGFGMMGPGRGPFMQGMGGRGGPRPMGMPPMFPPQPGPQQGPNRGPKRDQRGPNNDWGETYGSGPEPGKALNDPQHQTIKAQPDDKYGSRSNLRNDDSESEDEAPRRSRHGEGKKKRRDVDGDVHSSD